MAQAVPIRSLPRAFELVKAMQGQGLEWGGGYRGPGRQAGLLAALPAADPALPVQRRWAHKMRNVLATVRRAKQPAVKADLQAVMNARTLPQARSAARHRAPLSRGPATNPTHGRLPDRTSMVRILFAVFHNENRNQGVSAPRLLTQTF